MMPGHNDLPPEHGGIVNEPNENDVLSGRGGRINSHPGNIRFRELVNKFKLSYISQHTKKLDKVKIANEVVQKIRCTNPPGRFLKEARHGSNAWIEIGDERARKKAGQAMREKSAETKKQLEHGAFEHASPTKANSIPNSPYAGNLGYPNHSPQYSMSGSSPSNNASSPYATAVSSDSNYLPHGMTGPTYDTSPEGMQQRQIRQQQFQLQHLQQQQIYQEEFPSSAQSSYGTRLTKKNNPGLLQGNAVAFDREFNKFRDSDSTDANCSSFGGSFGASIASSPATSLRNASMFAYTSSSSNRTSDRSADNFREEMMKEEKLLDPLDEDDEVNHTSWNDDWDRRDAPKKQNADRRSQFRQLKSESSLNTSTDDISGLNVNEMMKESVGSVEIRRSTMSMADASMSLNMKSTEITDSTFMSMESMSNILANGDFHGIQEDFAEHSEVSCDVKKSTSNPNSERSNESSYQMPRRRGVIGGGISDAEDNSMRSATSSSWLVNDGASGMELPSMRNMELTESNRQRLFSDYSNRSISDMSTTMNAIDLVVSNEPSLRGVDDL